MEAMNNYLSFTPFGTLNQDAAIRRFCAARVEQEHEGLNLEESVLNEIDLWSPHSDSTTSTPLISSAEEEQFVDSFINIDCCIGDDNLCNKSPEDIPPSSSSYTFQENVDTLSFVNEFYVDVDPMIEGDEYFDICGDDALIEDVGVVSEVVSCVDQGIHLVHLLLACAEAIGCRDTGVATSLLNQIWASASLSGDSLQRVSFCFAMGLSSRLSLLHNVGANGALMITNAALHEVPLLSREEKMEAFQFLYQTTPYIAFGFMAANEAIFAAIKGKGSLHIIDLGMEHVLQWPSLLRTLASCPESPPKVRITGIIGHPNDQFEVEMNMKALRDDASSLGIYLEFRVIPGPSTPSQLTSENLCLRDGECLIVNSIMLLHKHVKESRGSLKAILQAIKKLNPNLLTVVEQDANHNGPFFLGRFLESLHYYSAIFDSLEASLPRNSIQRSKIERLHFTEEIRNIVAYEGSDRVERHERADQWRRQLARAGFQGMGLKSMSHIRMMLSVYGCDGYTLASDNNCILLGWKGRPIMFASAWQLHNVSSS